MRLRGLGPFFCALCAMSASAAATEYVIDTKGGHASINFRVQHLGFSWLTGRFDTFSGVFRYDEKNPSASAISVTIDTTSVNSNHAERDKHLRGPDFLDVATFPRATFVSKSVTADGNGKAVIAGDFTLRGITRPVAITAAYIGGGADPWGGFRHGFTGKAALVLSDFGIIRELGPAAKTVELEFQVEGVRK